MWDAWKPKKVINENPEMFLREPFMKLVKKTSKVTEEPSMLSWKKTSCDVLKKQNGNNSKPKNGFRKTFMVMVENPFTAIAEP